jgi:surfeit locus 1 family protein
MLDSVRKNELLLRIVPPIAALTLIIVFAALGNWQLGRAAEKVALAGQFEETGPYTPVRDIENVVPFQPIESRGRFLGQRQFLINNIVRNDRAGYFVVTAFELGPDQPLLMVNRGWIEKPREPDTLADISVGENQRILRGRAGDLPRVGIRSDEPFARSDGWPLVALYPTLSDLSQQLDRDVFEFTLLLDSDADDGYLRDWLPKQVGPSTHYGYAFQWFALSLAVIVLSIRQLRKKRSRQ